MTGWNLDLHIRLMDPEVIAAARARYEQSARYLCGWGTCVNLVDPTDGTIWGGWGSPYCPCETTRGWRSKRMAGRPLPSAPVKAIGRNGSRVQRSRHRKQRAPMND